MTRMSLQELCYLEAQRATRAENELKTARKERTNARQHAAKLTAKVAQLEAENSALRGTAAPQLGRYHRYWIQRFTPAQIIDLARGLEASD